MERLTDLKPLEVLDLPGLGDVDTSGLILVVGPNSSGKSQLLHDIHLRASGMPRELVVAKSISIRKPAYEPFIECLKREGYLSSFIDDSGTHHLRPMTSYLGSGAAASQIQLNQAQTWYQSYTPSTMPTVRRNVEFLNYFGRLLVTALFLDRRLTSLNQVGMFDYETAHPQNDLHVLYLDDEARDTLLDEVLRTFAKAVWPDASRGTTLCLRVSEEQGLPSEKARLSPKQMSKYRTIETEGDGLKSYVATCIALLLGRRPVCLVDEPEMCLHPPQAYNLGRFIGRYGSSLETVTFVATHSSHVLRGVIQTADRLQIVRLTRQGESFAAHLVPSDVLTDILAKPTVRAESVLDGIFTQGVAVVEADGDRTVYQAVWESLSDEYRLDLHFAVVGGTGGIADTCKLYRALRIPIAVVADLDIILDNDKLRRILREMNYGDGLTEFLKRARDVATMIKQLPPTVSEEVIQKGLEEAASTELDWSKGSDESLRKTLLSIARDLDRMGRLKRGGLSGLPVEIAQPLSVILEDLRRYGLFVVPVGELEGWLADEGVTASKQNKWAWANDAAARVRELGPQDCDVWSFMRSVGQYISAELRNTASTPPIEATENEKLAPSPIL